MHSLSRQFLVLTTLVAATAAAGAMAASGAGTVKITNCNKASSRPKQVTLTCGDGNTALSGLRWSSFGGASASAAGTFLTNTCTPNCAEGKVVRFPVSVKAYDTRSCKRGLRVYNKLTLKFTARKPSSAGNLTRWTLGCPM
ncbi:MAG TPA: hypothetical protein VK730_09065 [Solirubrobacteraceae bacterium]|jgi:hypothetical protein|nr:hypothetical protein [Solirubrobacteraceae bacterium]